MFRFHWSAAAGRAALLMLAALQTMHTQAQTPVTLTPLTIEGDAEQGKTLSYTCLGCHGVEGYVNAYPTYHVPKLAGQNADYLEIALQGYRSGNRSHQTMQAQAAELSDQDIADIAAYFAGLDLPPERGKFRASAAALAAGQSKASTCAFCHGVDGVAETEQWPNLAGQHASYIEQSLTQYKNGSRADMVMGPLMNDLDAQAIEEIAAFYAAQPGTLASAP